MARDLVVDESYFGTLMVALGMADGMVSGATHTTAETIRPALELIKTVEGVSIVSSVFFMCLADRVLVYGDCAVNVHPTAEQLAEIAISSAVTAAQFGVEPRVAMLSYSTGTSGSGEGVERVRTATALVRERAPDLYVEGPIQYDAAVDVSVARTKLPDSEVAGRATVFVFPDLNTGNNTYKAVQRSANAVAVGPVLQGLRRPVNDLSRGATVQDIVNTVAITAIQAQHQVAS
jgi:phosphate acetyltransferase